MKQLILLRHAEAEPAQAGISDIDRVLTQRGRLEAVTAAQAIASAGLTIDEVLISPAQRTRETASIVTTTLRLQVPVAPVPALYLGAPYAILVTIQGCRPAAQTLLLIAHNPGISELIPTLAHDAQEVLLHTAGACHLTLPQDSWDQSGTTKASAFEVLR
jgi:phosphohistidine phosphatase